jgi:hypothetical protein
VKTIAAAAVALFVCSACGGPLDAPATSTGRTAQGLEMTAVVVPLPQQPRMSMDIIDVVDVTDIVVTPKDRLELVRTGRASFEQSHITMDFQKGSGGCGCGCGGHH